MSEPSALVVIVGFLRGFRVNPTNQQGSPDAGSVDHCGRERAMRRKEAIDELREIQEIADLKVGHRLADDVLCRLLHSLGYADVVAEYNKVGKWYDSQ
jgi:hypothetical protein